MTSSSPRVYVPAPVLDAFGAPGGAVAQPLGLAWDYGVRVGQLAFSPVVDHHAATISAKIRLSLQPEGLRFARPVRATDSRFVAGGWRASHLAAGELTDRIDETVAAALRLDTALAVGATSFQRPKAVVAGLQPTASRFALADLAAWSNEPGKILETGFKNIAAHATAAQQTLLEFAAELNQQMQHGLAAHLNLPVQLCHADMLATTIYWEDQPPLVTDIVPVWRPYGYSAAIAVVDALLVDATEVAIIHRFRHIPAFAELVQRAALFRCYALALAGGAPQQLGALPELLA